MENLEVHLAVSHLKLVSNDREFRAKREQCKPLIAPYREKIPFTLVDSQTGYVGEGQVPIQIQQKVNTTEALQLQEKEEIISSERSG